MPSNFRRNSFSGTKKLLGENFTAENIENLSIEGQWIGIKFNLTFDKPARIYALPIKTISQSESGFEKVYQNTAVIPVWWFNLKNSRSAEFEINLNVFEILTLIKKIDF